MNFLFPAFLVGALAVAVPLLLHLLRRDVAPEVPFSAVRLLRRSPVEQSKRRRLRDLLLLAARVAALLLLAAAFARPYLSGGSPTAALHIIAIDRSFSMGAPMRFAHARDLAHAAVREAGLNDRVAVIAFDDRADVVAVPGSRSEADAAIDAMEPGFGTTRYAAALRKAIEVADGAPARVVLVTDLQRRGWEGEQPTMIPSSLQVEMRDTGEPPANLAVVSVRLEDGRVVATVRNTGAARSGGIRALVDGRAVGEVPFGASANASTDVAIPLAARSGVLEVSLDDAQGIPADDRRFVILDRPVRPGVLLVTDAPGTGFYLSRALSAGAPAEDGFDLRVVDGKALASIPRAALTRQAAVVLLSTRRLERPGRDALAAFVRAGGGLLVAAAGDVEPSVLSTTFDWQPPLSAVEQAGDVSLTVTDLRHPIFRPFGVLAANLGQVRFARGWRVGGEGWTVLARFTDGTPALLERREAEGRLVLFASDVDRRWNDFPLHPAFVPFAVESVRYVMGTRERVREYLIAQAPAGVPPRPGAFRVPPDNRTIVLNVDSRESSSARLSAAEFEGMLQRVEPPPSGVVAARAQQEEARQSYWQYGLLLMLGVLVVESYIGKV